MSRGGREADPRDADRTAARSHTPLRGRTRHPAPRTIHLPRGSERQPVQLGARTLWLSGKDVRVLATIGRFGSVFSNDLRDSLYDGKARHARRSLDKLTDQGLLDHREWKHAPFQWGPIVTLTRDAQRLLDRAVVDEDRPPECQGAMSSGWRKVRELTHDSTLFYLYQTARRDVETDGGRVVGLQLESDLKAELLRATETRVKNGEGDRDAVRAQVARDMGLPVIDGACQLPDMRLEVEQANGDRETHDLELATEHYHRGHLASKQRAGFTVYGLAGRRSGARTAPPDGSRLGRLL